MAFGRTLRRVTFTAHVTSSVGWVGAVLVFLALAAIGLTSLDENTVRGAYLVMAPAAWFVLVPLAHTALVSGIALSLGTPWGLIRHYWVVLKLVITAFSTVILLIYMRTFREMAGVAADPVATIELVRNPSPLLHAIFALLFLLAATLLAIYKPFGTTPYGARRQLRPREDAPRAPLSSPPASAAEGPLLRKYLLWILAFAITALIILSHLLGGLRGH